MALQVPELLDTKTYTFQRVRAMLADMGLQPGVIAPGDLVVSQRAAGANMSVDVAAGSGWVLGVNVARQGLYHVVDVGGSNVVIGAAHATLPRVDQVFVRVEDSTAGGAADQATYYVAAGTATAGATLDNRSGAGPSPATWATPWSVLQVADVLVPAAATTIVAASIRDRRPWARGANGIISLTSGDMSLAATTSWQAMPISAFRVECSGVAVTFDLSFDWWNTVSSTFAIGFAVNGAAPPAVMPAGPGTRVAGAAPNGQISNFMGHLVWTPPSPGSYLFRPAWAGIVYTGQSAGQNNVHAVTGEPFILEWRENLRPGASNG